MTKYRNPDAIIETGWLAGNLDDPKLRIFDCTTHLRHATEPGQPYRVESGRADYERGHIPGAGYLDLKGELSEADAPFRFMLPSAEQFAAAMSAHGVGEGVRVVLYSTGNPQWATRIWWMLRAFGFDRAAVLNGGWAKWQAEGRPTSTDPAIPSTADFTARPRPGLFVGPGAVKDAIGDAAICTINALSPELHRGDSARYGRPGRIPGSTNVPAASLLDPADNTFLAAEAVAAHFSNAGATPDNKVIAYCGGGIAATLDAFLLHQLGYTDIAVYDESMSQWATDESLPIETG